MSSQAMAYKPILGIGGTPPPEGQTLHKKHCNEPLNSEPIPSRCRDSCYKVRQMGRVDGSWACAARSQKTQRLQKPVAMNLSFRIG